MAKIIKTYGVNDLIEWECVIKSRGVQLHVNFTGGNYNGLGRTPAKYTTASVVVQHIIESSDYFKSGYIKLLRTVGDGAEVATQSQHTEQPQAVAPVEQPAEAAAAETPAAMQRKEFTSESDAVAYFVDTFGAAKRVLRSRSQIIKFGAANGIEVVFI